tara:strand:- start:10 stop:900 length:891 start_codon:yes stop_codon:yes gene_type:complete
MNLAAFGNNNNEMSKWMLVFDENERTREVEWLPLSRLDGNEQIPFVGNRVKVTDFLHMLKTTKKISNTHVEASLQRRGVASVDGQDSAGVPRPSLLDGVEDIGSSSPEDDQDDSAAASSASMIADVPAAAKGRPKPLPPKRGVGAGTTSSRSIAAIQSVEALRKSKSRKGTRKALQSAVPAKTSDVVDLTTMLAQQHKDGMQMLNSSTSQLVNCLESLKPVPVPAPGLQHSSETLDKLLKDRDDVLQQRLGASIKDAVDGVTDMLTARLDQQFQQMMAAMSASKKSKRSSKRSRGE